MEKVITGKVRKNLNEHTARIILERSDRLASSTLEQLRKSTDRAYTMAGFLLTVFIALTAFVFSSPSLWQLSTAAVLWAGIFIALYIMVNQVLWVHSFRHTGNEPRNMIQEENIDRLLKNGHNQEEMNNIYSINTLLDAISHNQEIIDRNRSILADRCDHIEKAMTVIKCTVIVATVITVISFLVSALGMYHGSAI
jgi:VIT1/CCC1 family predicted Fe2+/Mn2+ transporter